MSQLGERLKTLRRERHLSQQDLAQMAGVSIDEIGSLEQGRIRDPRLSVALRLAAALRISLGQLVEHPRH